MHTLSTVIVLPITAFLASRFGRKRYLIASVLLFTGASFLCGISSSLLGVVLCRVLQGAGAEALTSTSQAAIIEIFPEEEQERVQPIFMLGIIAAPTFGPMLGGCLTDNLSWHWCFLVNVPIGVAATFAVAAYLRDTERPQHSAGVDWGGIILLTVGLGSLHYVLEEGVANDAFWTLALRGLSMGLLVVPINQAVVSALKPGEVQHGVALMNLADQLGGSLGIAVLASQVAAAIRTHYASLITHMASTNPAFNDRLSGLTGLLASGAHGPGTAQQAALAVLVGVAQRQAIAASDNDAFLLMLYFVVLTAPASLLLRKRDRSC